MSTAFLPPSSFFSKSRYSLSSVSACPQILRKYAVCPRAALSTDKKTDIETLSDVSAEPNTTRMFSNIAPGPSGNLERLDASELSCTALIAGTMIGAGVLALPTVAAPAGFVPSSAALIGIWIYMAATGMLISEVTINTACALGRPRGISLLSLSQLTLGTGGAILTAATYTLLHYAILTAYVSQGGSQLIDLIISLAETAHISFHPTVPPLISGSIFASIIGGLMYYSSPKKMEKINNSLVVCVLMAFCAVVTGAAQHLDAGRLLSGHWSAVAHGELIPVLFVSCVYHNIVSTVTMRLEGDRRKVRRAIIGGSAVPVIMFLAYNAAILGSDGSGGANHLAIEIFSVLAIATSFVGFVEGLTELWSDLRQTIGSKYSGKNTRWQDFAATLFPPVVFASTSPDIFLKALDVAGTYGIAVLFGGIPALMAWRNRRERATKDFGRILGGGDVVLSAVAIVPILLIGSRLWESVGGRL